MWTSEDTARELLAILPLISRVMVSELRQEASQDTTIPQFRVLSYLSEGSLTLSEIARRRRVSLQAAGELVQALVDRGWISRVPDPNDRRQIQLHLTESGREQYIRAHDRILTHLIPIIEMLTDEETTAVEVALHALQRVLTREEVIGVDS